MNPADWLQGRLESGEVVIMDGGTGTEIPRRGVPLSPTTWSGSANLSHPGVVRQIHEDYIRAGAEVIITNTFSTGRWFLEPGGLAHRTAEINKTAVKLAQEARDKTAPDKPVAIAGSMSTFKPPLDPTVTPSYEAALAGYREQAQVLAEAGVDLLVLEMLIRTVDARAAVQAASETGLPIWVGYSLQRIDGGLYLGIRGKRSEAGVAEAVDAVAAMGVSAFFIMHTPIEETGEGLQALRERTSVPMGAYAHALDIEKQGGPGELAIKPLTAAEYLRHGREWVSLGAQVIGGCCGTTPEHIKALSEGLPSRLSS